MNQNEVKEQAGYPIDKGLLKPEIEEGDSPEHHHRLTKRILLGMFFGIFAGLFLKKDALFLGEFGTVLVSLVKLFASPLLFFSIISAILHTDIRARSGFRMLRVAMTNASIACLIGLAISNWLRPGDYLPLGSSSDSSSVSSSVSTGTTSNVSASSSLGKLEFGKVVQSFVPTSVMKPFVENNVLGIVFLALFFAFAIRSVRSKALEKVVHFREMMDLMLLASEKCLYWVIQFTPIAVFAVTAKSVGEYGFQAFKGLGIYVLIVFSGFMIHALVVYQAWIVFFKKGGIGRLKLFWREALPPISFAFGANSSLATLPLTLKALDRLKVSKESATLGACIGTNFNNDGIILYEAMAVLMLAQAYDVPLTIASQLGVAATCMIAAMGVAGVPEAGFISLTIVVSTLGLPAESLPLLLTVDWLIARARSVMNVLSDMVVSIGVDD